MLLSKNIEKRMKSGSIRHWFEEGARLKQKHGVENVFDLSLGNPIVEPTKEFKDELCKMAKDRSSGRHMYMENAGYADVRAAIARQMSLETGIKFDENDIIMTVGAAGGLNVVFKSILDPGDEVIVFSPFFTEFSNYINNHGGIMKLIATDDKFIPRLDLLEQNLTKQTKIVLLNTPNNPTGVVYHRDFIENITDLLKKKEEQIGRPIALVMDEAYRKLIYDNLKYTYIFKYYRNSITVNSHSKDLGLPGERIGYITIHPECDMHDEMVAAMIFCNRTLGFVNAPAIMQHIVKNLQNVTVDISHYEKNRDFLYENLIKMGYHIVKPQGAFYMFPKSPVDENLFTSELRNFNILTVPGSSFGTPGYFRIAYCVKDSVLEGSLKGFKEVAKKFII